MDRLRIEGPCRLAGTIRASGAKNASLPILAATLLTDEPVTLRNLPQVRDIGTMGRLLGHLGVGRTTADADAVADADADAVADADTSGGATTFQATDNGASADDAPWELVKTMRASVLVLGPLLARRGRAAVSLPGGCAIGVRPVDQHLAGLEALGARIEIEHGDIRASSEHLPGARLQGARFRFEQRTVGGTENVMMAASLARGTTLLENCAREPEITDLGRLLVAMGAKISGLGTSTLEIEGVDALHGVEHAVIPDRIEVGTYLVGAVMTRGDVRVEGARAEDLTPLLDQLREVGATVESAPPRDGAAGWIRARHDGPIASRGVITEPHPGFPTDLQAQYVALMTQADGVAKISETVFENRFQHVPELNRMGAEIQVERSNVARVEGPTPLSGAKVMATDLRASACLVLAALVAEGETEIDRIYHLDRGYERMEAKLRSLGAAVERLEDR